MLFATEAFESFNAVIRAKSVHSNRQAPSRDIAMAFAEGNRIRHLLSGGYFLSTEFHAIWKENPQSLTASVWKSGSVRFFGPISTDRNRNRLPIMADIR